VDNLNEEKLSDLKNPRYKSCNFPNSVYGSALNDYKPTKEKENAGNDFCAPPSHRSYFSLQEIPGCSVLVVLVMLMVAALYLFVVC